MKRQLSARSAAIAAVLVFLAAAPILASGTAEASGFAVVELFTSEGCSSCPPADEVLARVVREARERGAPVYALGWHVDYWDYLGWKDPYGSAAASSRQRGYARDLDTGVYTPQAIVNGTEVPSYAGSYPAVRALIDAELAEDGTAAVSLGPIIARDRELAVPFHGSKLPDDAEIVVALVEDDLRQEVSAGENRGRTLTHRNVVRAFSRHDRRQGTAQLELPPEARPEKSSVIAFAQDTQTREIVAATQREITTSPASVRGRVVDAEGRPSAGTRVLVCSDFVCVPGKSDETGAFEVTGIPAGSYRVVVGTVDGQEVARVTLESGERRVLSDPVAVQ
jgi:hypothetical protein